MSPTRLDELLMLAAAIGAVGANAEAAGALAELGRLHGEDEAFSIAYVHAIRRGPRWLLLLRKLGRAPEQLAAVPLDARPSP